MDDPQKRAPKKTMTAKIANNLPTVPSLLVSHLRQNSDKEGKDEVQSVSQQDLDGRGDH